MDMRTKEGRAMKEANEQVSGGGDASLSGKRLRVTIPRPAFFEGTECVGGWNGSAFRIKFDTPVDVPVEYLAVLDDAVIGETREIPNAKQGEPQTEVVQVKRFPYTILRG